MDSDWHDFCFVCGDGGEVMCCSRCPRVAHHACVGLNDVPDTDWFCGKCRVGQTKIKVLELFKGTGSVSKMCAGFPHIFDVISVDIEPSCESTETCDIRDWNYSKYKPQEFDLIWASPPCTEYSIMKTRSKRDIPSANQIVLNTLEIINYLKPRAWFIENPQTGLLKLQDFMVGIPFIDVDYCRYSDFGYKKSTRIWTNVKNFSPLRCEKKCVHVLNGVHVVDMTRISLQARYRVPELLIYKLFWHASIECGMASPSDFLHI